MNQRFKYLMTSVLLIGMVVTTSAQKIGYVNSTALLQELPAFKQASTNLEALQTQLQKKGEGMVQAFQSKYQELQLKEQRGELSPKQLEDEGTALRAEETQIQQFEQDVQQQIAEKEQSLLQPIFDKVRNQIAVVAKENGYSFIFDSNQNGVLQQGTLLYKDNSSDITALVKTKLGL